MKKSILILTVILSQFHCAQVSFDGKKFLKDGQSYKSKNYRQVFTDPAALDLVKKGRTNKTVGDVFSGIGGFGMGLSLALIVSTPKERTYNLGYGYGSITQKTDNGARWTVFGISTGIALISIPFYVSAKKHFDKAIKTENGEPTTFKPYFKLGSEGDRLAVSYNF